MQNLWARPGFTSATMTLTRLRPISIRIRFLNNLTSPVYANLAMNAPYFRATQIVPELQQQCGQANVNGLKLRNIMIPLPPLAEQRRIVAKVDELMALCDQLQTEQRERETRQDRLAAASHHHLNNGANEKAFRSQARFISLTSRASLPKQCISSNSARPSSTWLCAADLSLKTPVIYRHPNCSGRYRPTSIAL